jgi:hypothetical protein
MNAVKFDDLRWREVLQKLDVPRPDPGPETGARRGPRRRDQHQRGKDPFRVRAAFTGLEAGHVAGKIVLIP